MGRGLQERYEFKSVEFILTAYSIHNVHRSFNHESRYPEPFLDEKTAGFFILLKLWPGNCTFKNSDDIKMHGATIIKMYLQIFMQCSLIRSSGRHQTKER
jgi:hypothetical protein